VRSPWPGHISVSSGKANTLLVMDSIICFKSPGDSVLPGPPGKIVSPEMRCFPIKKQTLPGV
jgi:hypothetical protein